MLFFTELKKKKFLKSFTQWFIKNFLALFLSSKVKLLSHKIQNLEIKFNRLKSP